MANYGAFSFNVIQLGREATAGTAVAASTIWRGPAVDIGDARDEQWPGEEESVGLLVPSNRSYTSRNLARLAMPETEVSYEQFLHILEAGVETATPTGTGPYVYTYNWPLATTLNTIKTYTLETGNAVAGDANEMEYAFVESFTLRGAAGEAWRVSANWVGRQKSTTTLTGSLSIPTVQEVLFQKSKLYIDDGGGTIGTTQKTGVLISASIEVTTGIVPVFAGDGNLYFASHKFVAPAIAYTLTMELESGTAVATERSKWVAGTVRLIRIDIPGSDATRNLRIDLAGRHRSFGAYQNADGNTTVQMAGNAVYSSTDSLFGEIVVTNNLAAVP